MTNSTTKNPRITNDMRAGIIRRLMADTFDKQDADLLEEESALFDKVYDRFVTPEQQAAAALLGDNWIESRGWVCLNAGGFRLRVRAHEGVVRPLPLRWTSPDWCLPADDPLCVEVCDHAKRADKLRQDREAARAKIGALLGSTTTLNALRTLWPEGEPYYAHLAAPVVVPNLPAVPVSEVNAAFGLPKSEKTEAAG